MAFKLEYRTERTGWETWMHCPTLVILMDEASRLVSQGFAVRCKNALGVDILARA